MFLLFPQIFALIAKNSEHSFVFLIFHLSKYFTLILDIKSKYVEQFTKFVVNIGSMLKYALKIGRIFRLEIIMIETDKK